MLQEEVVSQSLSTQHAEKVKDLPNMQKGAGPCARNISRLFLEEDDASQVPDHQNIRAQEQQKGVNICCDIELWIGCNGTIKYEPSSEAMLELHLRVSDETRIF